MRDRTPDSPLSGRYLVRDPGGLAALRCADVAIRLFAGRRPPLGTCETPPARLLLCNIAHLGDVTLATAVLGPLREAYPDAEIGLLTSSGSAVVVRDHPALRWLHTYDHWRLDRSGRPLAQRLRHHARTFAAAVREVAARRYDAAVDLYFHYPNAIGVLWAAGVPLRVGYNSGGYGDLLTHPLRWRDGGGHVVDYHLALLRELPGFAWSGAPLAPWLPPVEAPTAAPYLVLHPGSGAAARAWPLDHWLDLARRLARAGRALVLTGSGEAEQRHNAALARAVPGCVDRTGTLTWPDFVATVRGAEALVAVDTAAGHVASAWGVPSVILMTGINDPALWRPLGERVATVQRKVPCAPCHLSPGCEGMECIRDLTVEVVLEALARVEHT